MNHTRPFSAWFTIVGLVLIASVAAVSASADTIFSDDFSGSHPGAWSIGHDGGGGSFSWAWPNGYAHEYSDPSGGQYYYPDDLHVYMERRNVNLSSYSSAVLSFYHIVDTEEDWDYFTVNVRDQSGSWHEMMRESGPSDISWTYAEIDLSQFAGQTGLYIQFRFDSDGSVSGDPYDGVFIDSVSLEGTSQSYSVYGVISGFSGGADADGDGYWETYDFNIGIDGDVSSGSSSVYGRMICTTTNQAWWSSSPWTISGYTTDYHYFAFDETDFSGEFSGNTSLDFTVEVWDSTKTTLLATETSVSGEPVRVDDFIAEPTRFRGDHFVDTTAKYGIPVLLEAKLERDNPPFYNDIEGETVHFEVYYSGSWHAIPDDGISSTSFVTDSNGIASVYYTAPTSLSAGSYSMRARFDGSSGYSSSSLTRSLSIKRPQWLFMVYLAADNNLEAAGCEDFYEEMVQAHGNDEVSIVVLFDRASGTGTGYTTGYGDWTDTRYYRVGADTNIYNSWGESDMGSSSTLDSFISQATSECLAENVALVFWNHGNGWVKSGGKDHEEPQDVYQIRATPDLRPSAPTQFDELGDKGVCYDDTGGNLTLGEIRTVLSGYSVLELIGYDACLMGMVEVAFDNRNDAEYLVASEDTEGGDGWEYDDFLVAGALSSSTGPADLGAEIVSSFTTTNGTGHRTLGCWRLSSDLANLNTEISSFAERLIEDLPYPGTRTMIENAWSAAQKFPTSEAPDEYYIDLREFAQEIAAVTADTTLEARANNIVNRLASSSFRTSWDTNYSASLGGLSIYFPPDSSHWAYGLYFIPGYLDFVDDSNQLWDDFLVQYFDTTAPTNHLTAPNAGGSFSGDIAVSATASDSNGVRYVEFQYSLDHSNWYALPGPDSPDGKDWYEPNGWGLTFRTTNTPQHGTINDPTVWVRSRACDNAGNIGAWDESDVSFAVDNNPPAIGRTPSVLTPSSASGQNAASQSFEVWNSGGGTLSYTISDNASWLSCTPTSGSSTGEHDQIAVNYSTSGLSSGTHNATITISAGGASNTPQTIAVTLSVSDGPMIGRNPSALSPSCASGQNAASQSFEVWNLGGGTLSYTISDNVSWLSCTPTAGSSTGEHDQIAVNYSTSGLSSGTHNATITISAGGAGNTPQTIPVTLTVSDDPAIGRTPSVLTQSCALGQNAASQSFEVWNSGSGAMNYTVSDNASWLSCTPTSGSSTGEHDQIAVNYSTSGLSSGTHSATITISAGGASNTPQTISVTLSVAQEADLSSSVMLPGSIALGQPFTVIVGYANHGPDTANSAYPNGEFVPPMGLDVFLDNYWHGDGSMYDNLQNSATDTLGNLPVLFWEDFYCETVQFQVQGVAQPGSPPIAPLASGESGSFSFETAFPMESPRTGAVSITSPRFLAKTWTLTDSSTFFVEHGYGSLFSTYATTTCEQLVGAPDEDVCAYIEDNCWGTKVSHLTSPIEAEFVLVDDGSADPTYGCLPIINDVAGKIAVLERGTCEFGDKGFNAEQAGALAVFMVNDGRCGGFPDSPECVNNMGSGALGALVTIPMIQISQGDGFGLLTALASGETVTGVFGEPSTFATQGWTYHGGDSVEADPDFSNNVSVTTTAVSLFADGFESGDTTAWSVVTP